MQLPGAIPAAALSPIHERRRGAAGRHFDRPVGLQGDRQAPANQEFLEIVIALVDRLIGAVVEFEQKEPAVELLAHITRRLHAKRKNDGNRHQQQQPRRESPWRHHAQQKPE